MTLRVGLTGGIGSGKSTVAKLFQQQWHVPIIDADQISHQLTQTGAAGHQKIVETFGPAITDELGHLDRAKLRQIVFAHPEKRRKLEQLLHPLVLEEMRRQLQSIDAPYCLLVIPLLIEARLQHWVDRILVIDVPEELQIKRVMARSNLSRSDVNAILNAQCSRAQRLEHADDIIDNSCKIMTLEPTIKNMHEFYLKLSQKDS